MKTKEIKLLLLLGTIFLFSISEGIIADDDDEGKYFTIITPNILDAYYGDLDEDGYEDDVFAEIEFSLRHYYSDDDDDWEKTKYRPGDVAFYVELYLILPSGQTFAHKLKYSTDDRKFVFEYQMINHAIESGWYTLIVETATEDMMRYNYETSDKLVFDPPGGGGGGQLGLLI
ncbi:MAG: hypothetical protein ACW99A_04520 [Candidatus Kariarchaeaceae archaeon]|jgi:hypothetical protein